MRSQVQDLLEAAQGGAHSEPGPPGFHSPAHAARAGQTSVDVVKAVPGPHMVTLTPYDGPLRLGSKAQLLEEQGCVDPSQSGLCGVDGGLLLCTCWRAAWPLLHPGVSSPCGPHIYLNNLSFMATPCVSLPRSREVLCYLQKREGDAPRTPVWNFYY